ncbi:NfeD family protein [Devosia lacusdianchii]|jgi:membrane protein implicated in regulation of membrane protease activity|uniref:NfeD family protein n=1 Tax=Devosia lacusdianchii TaxID=2917991 RepID=UPI001F063C11|nr:NfeD family protein [Devosia sp. JXJ CY 41]
MQVIDFIAANGPWSWIVAGLVLLALELVVPGGFMLWMGIAGIITGLITLFQPIGWPMQWLIFGVLSLVAIAIWVRWNRSRPAPTDRPYLNRRADTYVGQEAVLEQAITQGFGRIVLGDTVWRVAGPDLPVGQRVRITGSDGAVLKVEAVR